MHGADVAALLNALPASTLPVELIALRDLGAVVNLACHWPVVHITKIPIQYARLGITALPAFAGVYIDAGFTTLVWLDATLPPTMPVTLVVDPSVTGLLGAFAYNWGDRITNVIVKSHEVQPDPIPDILSRCVNVQSVTITSTIQNTITPVAAASYLSVLRTTQLVALNVTVAAPDALDVMTVVAWLQGPSAASLSLPCVSVSDPTALASAIQACSTLATLRLDCAVDVQTALVSSPTTLHHITALSLSHSSELITLHEVQFDHTQSVPTIIQWLSSSRHLTSVDFTYTKLGKEGVLALARALPVWMARGLKMLTLYGTELTDDDVVVLTLTSTSLLLATLGACHNVTLRLGHRFGKFDPQHWCHKAANEDRIQDLVDVHGLQSTEPGVYTSPTRASSPWQTL
ncbi:hypothetical protein SPRG_14661 [Saprolegnia parasitica CBS 223.65]|uniref:F-box domain-containing protein n=1 Tax=Saprolegnia parasitica (strain CBS 223.65) TaxID=695850 RepID=A0A067BMM8_SAPPC|nr:hypothetical protein SPRG_14661 [Saprolegnia parasitica CBS 223.65]KDO19478.1 hypothetical protein SPRG_14661 [Saprolegnia parasitica CBS 223.65]|eukprot:XP_012209821.1 hypothetical protein SPRG_14661 [Saprolegnia parasitica CBS 223.65]